MSFISKDYAEGQMGKNVGLTLGPGLEALEKYIYGVTRGTYYAISAPAKCGKTTLLNYGFVINPILEAVAKGKNFKWLYYSLELDLKSLFYDFCTYFMYRHHNLTEMSLPHGITYGNGSNTVPLSPYLLRGFIRDDNGNLIKLDSIFEEKFKSVSEGIVTDFLGEWDDSGKLLKEGYMRLVFSCSTPEKLRDQVLNFAAQRGTIQMDGKSPMFYVPHDPDEIVMICLDHTRKLGDGERDSINRMSKYFVILRNILNYSIVNIIHSNRDVTDINKIKFSKSEYYPDESTVMGSSNIVQDVDFLITLLNPNDPKFGLVNHFDIRVREAAGMAPNYPNLITAHLVASRRSICPKHFKMNLVGNLKMIDKFKI